MMPSLFGRLRHAISSRVHNRRLQLRLQVGSTVALASAVIAAVLLTLGIFSSWDYGLYDFLLGVPSAGVRQDLLIQVVVIFLLALLGGATLPHLRFLSATALMFLYVVFYWSYALENSRRGIIAQPLYPLLSLELTFVAVMAFRYLTEERTRNGVSRLFRRYVSKEDVSQVLRKFDNNTLRLAGERRLVTLLHVDLRALSIAADTLPAQTAVDLINEYFRLIIPIIFQNAGTIVKQSGTGIMAIWNIPLERITHAADAVHAAMDIRRKLAPLEIPRAMETSGQRIQLGYGIATGQAIGAHVGVQSHSEYTIIGEVITIAERLAMKPDRGIFVDDATRNRLGGQFELRQVNPVRLRRQTDPFTVWEVLEPLVLEELPQDQMQVAK